MLEKRKNLLFITARDKRTVPMCKIGQKQTVIRDRSREDDLHHSSSDHLVLDQPEAGRVVPEWRLGAFGRRDLDYSCWNVHVACERSDDLTSLCHVAPGAFLELLANTRRWSSERKPDGIFVIGGERCWMIFFMRRERGSMHCLPRW